MFATMARQRGWVHLEQSDMHLALNMAKMAKGGFSRTTITETQYLIKKPHAKMREKQKQGVVFPANQEAKCVIQRLPAMLR